VFCFAKLRSKLITGLANENSKTFHLTPSTFWPKLDFQTTAKHHYFLCAIELLAFWRFVGGKNLA